MKSGVGKGRVLEWCLWAMLWLVVGRVDGEGAEVIRSELLQRFEARTWTNASGVVVRYRWFDPRLDRRVEGRGFLGGGTNRLPLVVVLHGAVGRGEDNEKQFAGGNQVPAIALISEGNQGVRPSYVMYPQCPRGESWNWGGGRERTVVQGVLDFLEMAPNRHGIDTNRIYLVGLSMGGSGAWRLGAMRRDLFAAVVPICGAGDTGLAVRMKDMPVWCFHGDADPLVSVRHAREMVAEIRRLGGSPRYTEYAGVGHSSYEPAFREVGLLPWLYEQRRGRGP